MRVPKIAPYKFEQADILTKRAKTSCEGQREHNYSNGDNEHHGIKGNVRNFAYIVEEAFFRPRPKADHQKGQSDKLKTVEKTKRNTSDYPKERIEAEEKIFGACGDLHCSSSVNLDRSNIVRHWLCSGIQ